MTHHGLILHYCEKIVEDIIATTISCCIKKMTARLDLSNSPSRPDPETDPETWTHAFLPGTGRDRHFPWVEVRGLLN